jgi:inhibitor of KinA
LVRVGTTVNEATSAQVHALVQRLREQPIEGVCDIAPAFTTVALHYRPECFGPRPFARLKELLLERLGEPLAIGPVGTRVIEVPVCYGGELGPDLDEVAAKCGLDVEQAIAIHLASRHRVYMLGFSPGFPFIGGLDARLAMPRRSTPRTRIAPGSVAIQRDQTCIYPLETPGGWNLIGRTPLRLFDPQAGSPCLLRPGDEIRFVRIDDASFRTLPEVRA